MEEVINKPDSQFKDILNDLIDYTKDSEEKSALIEEVCRSKHSTKPAASLNSSTYSSAASSSSSTSSASDSSANSASSSSTSSTLSSPSQSSQKNGENNSKRSTSMNNDYDKLEVAKMEDLGKTARILEHRLALSSEHRTTTTVNGLTASSLHSDRRPNSLHNNLPRLSSSLISQTQADKLTQEQYRQQNKLQADLTNLDNNTNQINSNVNVISDNISVANSWKTISGKRDKRRRKPTEQPVLSQHIPGHRGEQEVDWLVNFIESGPGATSNANNSNNNSSKKNNKNTKAQSKRQFTQTMEPNRENQQRKINSTVNNNTKSTPTQTRTTTLTQASTENTEDLMTDNYSSNDKRVLVARAAIQPQTVKSQSTVQDHVSDRSEDRKDTSRKPVATNAKRSQEEKRDKSKRDDAVVTFADHIRVSDEDLGDRYTFGFFDKQQKQQPTIQSKSIKPTSKHNESKSNQIGQKHKLKHLKASLISEQKRYKCNDNIDANSFNYHQILEFISTSWESTAKSHRPMIKHIGA